MTKNLPTLVRATVSVCLVFTIASSAFAADSPIVNGAKDFKWGPALPLLPKGAMLSLMAGDPAATGPVSVRLKVPAGYEIARHWHPTDEQITVLSGAMAIDMSDVLDKAKGQTLRAGGFGVAPANMHHCAWTTGGAKIQLNLTGPLNLTCVITADDPRTPAAK